MSTYEEENNIARNEKLKNVEESYTDSGFHSGFQDSCEIQSDCKSKTDIRGNSPYEDKENLVDSGIISSGNVSKPELKKVMRETSLYVPEFLKNSFRRPQQHSLVDKYFERDDDGYTKLHLAIIHGVENAINALIRLVPDSSYLNIRSFVGQTALHLAVLLGQHSTVKMLINAGIDINIRDNRCDTALHLACLMGDIQSIEIIISAFDPLKKERLVNMEQWNYDGETCFYISCKERNISMMSVLASNGADVNAREGRSGYTALHKAVEAGATDVIKFLCEECKDFHIDTENYSGLTAFQISLLTSQENLASYLITNGGTPYFTQEESDNETDDADSDLSDDDDFEKNQIISKIAGIAVN
ncbi:CLUMA_CG002629, isoform A [Clunio marinus]|uniref:CLUMA_CG002629, isoform A n=1 Tax=Clunio marinus TaxID=568069 RepID=A0A1J1HLP3_9DIPT|nr:CLUMA_CG002629, isoform A [Clunio marinus]